MDEEVSPIPLVMPLDDDYPPLKVASSGELLVHDGSNKLVVDIQPITAELAEEERQKIIQGVVAALKEDVKNDPSSWAVAMAAATAVVGSKPISRRRLVFPWFG